MQTAVAYAGTLDLIPRAGAGYLCEWSTANYLNILYAPDGQYGVCVNAEGGVASYSNWLQCTGFGFDLPTNAVIAGATPAVYGHGYEDFFGEGLVVDSSLRLIVDGTLRALDLATADGWPTADAWITHVGTDEVWGGLYPADVNGADFGFGLSVYLAPTFGHQMNAILDAVRMTVRYYLMTGAVTSSRSPLAVSVNADGLAPDEPGVTMSSYTWDWGDGSDPSVFGYGTADHVYAAPGSYTITLTVELSDGNHYRTTVETEVYMSVSITSVGPLAATRGSGGTLVTIGGTGFGETIGLTGMVSIGAVTAIIASWGPTTITCRADDDPATPLGSQDIIVQNTSGETALSQSSLYVYDATDNKDAADIGLGIVDEVFLGGLQVGFTNDALDMNFPTTSVSFEPADRFDTVAEFTYSATGTVGLTFSHFDGTRMAAVMGGTYANNVYTLAGNTAIPETSLMVKEASGVIHVFPRVKPTGDVRISLNKSVRNLPVTFKVLSLSQATAKKYQCSYPA